jgi:NAD(P)-dependent dehydrogenase (short-subunit alcohol dehydrogenase family)
VTIFTLSQKPKIVKQIKKTVLITGAGRGLGRATAEAFLLADYTVFASDNNPDLLTDLVDRKNIIPIMMDVTSEAEVKKTARKLSEITKGLDVLVSNAAIFDFYPLAEAGAEKLKTIFDVNVFGLANLTKYFLPQLINAKGRLIVISSESHKVPSPFQPYSVSKQSLEKLYQGIRIELETKGVTSVLIRPGAIQTQILDDTVNFEDKMENSIFKETFHAFVTSVPKFIGTISYPSEVAKIVYKAATKKRPKAVYSVNHNPLVSILSILPEKVKSTVVRKNLK